MAFSDELQAVSVDEALIDVTTAVRAREQAPEEADDDVDKAETPEGEKRQRDPAVEIANKIRDEVRKETGCEGEIHACH
jgi:DNA repair protein REV1